MSASGPIVIAFDGSAGGKDALALGAWIAGATGAAPIAVMTYPKEPMGVLPGIGAEWVAELHDHAKEIVATARPALAGHPGAEVRAVGAASAAQGLDRVASRLGAEVIVVGSSGRGIHRRVSNNHTANRLFQGASVPILIAPRGFAERDLPPLERVGCAFVPTREGRRALRAAHALAKDASARLEVFTVVAPHAELPRGELAEQRELAESYRSGLAAAADRAIDALPKGAVEIAVHLLDGEPVGALAALEDEDCQVLVCGSRNYGPIERVLLGGISERLVRRAVVPVMVVPRSAR